MAAKSLDVEINKFLPLLGNDEKKSLLSVIKSFLNLKKEDTPRINLEEYNREIDEAMAEVASGKFYTHEEVVKMSANW